MLSIAAVSNGQGNYYTSLARDDYYVNGGEPPGRWLGEGAKAWGLRGNVVPEDFRCLARGFCPKTLRPLEQNAGSSERQAGLDLTFSADKTVSVLWSQCGPAERKQIEEAQFAAVAKVIEFAEKQIALTRRGKAGQQKEKSKLVGAVFPHGTSREGDPQQHLHVVLFNVTVREDGTTGTLYGKPLFQWKMTLGALYRAELAHQLQARLGVEIIQGKDSFRIGGIPEKLVTEFSKRREQIKDRLAVTGECGAKAAADAALDTRVTKVVGNRSELFAAWKRIGEIARFNPEKVLNRQRLDRNEKRQEAVATKLATQAITEITKGESTFSERDILRAVARDAPYRGISAGIVVSAVHKVIEKSAEVVKLGVVNDQKVYTTKEILDVEKRMLDWVERSRSDSRHVVSASVVEKEIAKKPKLNNEQADAVRHVTVKEGSLSLVSGMAGTGKSTFLAVANSIWKREGFNTYGATISAKAADGLEKASQIKSDTICGLLNRLEPSAGSVLRHEAKQFGRALVGKSRNDKHRLRIDRKTIVVIDEAGMVGTLEMERLARLVLGRGGKLVLCGDFRQLQPIASGAPFKAIGKRLGQAVLTTIVRQREAWAKEAVKQFSQGDSEAALKAYADRGLLKVSKDRDAAISEVVADWSKHGGVDRPKDNLMFAATKKDVAALNQHAQRARQEAGLLGKGVTVNGERIHEGDQIRFTRNSKVYDVRNGHLGVVVKVGSLSKVITVKLEDERMVTIPLKKYSDLTTSYALTCHASQGITIENSYILLGGSMQDREISYVQASRARGTTRMFCDEESSKGLAQQMARSRQKNLAHEVIAYEC